MLETTNQHPGSNKIQNGDILIPANPGPRGKITVKSERENGQREWKQQMQPHTHA